MTIEQHINEQVLKLNLDTLTPDQRETLHFLRTLATWAYISKARRELDERKAA